MKRSSLVLSVLFPLLLGAVGCGPVGANVNGNDNLNQNANTNYNQNTNVDAAVVAGLVTLKGRVWSPGADLSTTLEEDRFPIPGVVVAAFHSPPPDLPQGMYCNECMEVPSGTPNELSDPITGEFEIKLMPNRTYYLAIQKGEFRRVREILVPDMPDQIWELSYVAPGPRPEELTLPNATNLSVGDSVPKIAVVDANYEHMDNLFNAVSMTYGGVDVREVSASIVNDRSQLDQYNIVIVPCGENWPGGDGSVLRQWVKDGGRLYVDDFNYDFVEIPWPDFLSFYTGSQECGSPSYPTDGSGNCNHWSSYNFVGDPGDADFGAWLALPDVNQESGVNLKLAYDYIYSMGEGIVGEDDECIGNCGPNGEVYHLPKVWMYNKDGVSFSSHPPATVSWPYYCGKVLYTVYHTEAGSSGGLLLQEKIMLFLIMEIQTCSTGPIVR